MKNILIIEDTPIQIRILDRILSPVYQIRAATNGKKGIELALKYPIDLILLDILMDDMSGYEVLEVLKSSEKTCNIPVIFITSMDSSKDEVKGLSSGAVDYITKPFVDEVVRLRVDLHMQLIVQMEIIENQSLYDSLTGIRNRHSFNITMTEEWSNASETGQCISMIMIDIDKFKNFNDVYGHLCGDICLKIVAETMNSCIYDGMLFRWGGEEFVVLLPGVSLDAAMGLAEKLLNEVSTTPIVLNDGTTTYVTISLGVGSIFPHDTDRPEEFCTEVDKALYKAKENGRNRAEIIDE